MSRTCPKCDAPVSAAARFCRSCGSELPVAPSPPSSTHAPERMAACASCQAVLVDDARFCHRCGHAASTADAGDAPTTTMTVSDSPGRAIAAVASITGSPPEPASARSAPSPPSPKPVAARPAALSTEPVRAPREESTIVSPEPGAVVSSAVSPQPTCNACQAPISEGARFCRSCGAPVERPSAVVAAPSSQTAVCPGCGEQVEAWARFCRHCGQDLPGQGGVQPSVDRGISCAICGAPKQRDGLLCAPCEHAMDA